MKVELTGHRGRVQASTVSVQEVNEIEMWHAKDWVRVERGKGEDMCYSHRLLQSRRRKSGAYKSIPAPAHQHSALWVMKFVITY